MNGKWSRAGGGREISSLTSYDCQDMATTVRRVSRCLFFFFHEGAREVRYGATGIFVGLH